MRKAVSRLCSALFRHYPLYSGCGSIANSRPFRALTRDLKELTWTRLHNGARILVAPTEFVGRSLYYFGDLDPKMTWICKRLLRQGDTVLDVGANIGLFSLTCAPLVGATGRVHAFEPNPRLAEMLRRSVAENRFSQIQVHPYALGEADRTAVLMVPFANAGEGSLTLHPPGPHENVTIELRHAGDYLTKLDLPHVRLIKMDVEGYEESVLKGARPFLETALPDAIIFEIEDPRPIGEHPVPRLLAEMGYQFLDVRKVSFRMRLFRVDPTNPRAAHGHELLAVRSGALYEEIARLVGA